MTLSLTLFLVVLWVYVDVSLSQNKCSGIPDVPNAYVSVDNGKTQVPGHEDVIRFTCDFGYVSAQSISFKCGNGTWKQLRQGTCVLKPCELPDHILGGEYQLVNGEDFVFGVTIKYVCNDDHTMTSREDTRTCMLKGWSNNLPVCEPVHCVPPSMKEGITMKGQIDDEPIRYGNSLRFSCDFPGQFLNGSAEVICSKNGEWSNVFPTCEDFTCAIGDRDTNLIVKGLPQNNETMKSGHKLKFDCNPKYALNGQEEVVCSSEGKWSAPLPTCDDICQVEGINSDVVVTGQQTSAKVGQSLRLQCLNQGTYLHGAKEIVCLNNGEWSAPFPTCGAPSKCGPPPNIPNGETEDLSKPEYDHNEVVKYTCPRYYTLQVTTNIMCFNGDWKGNIKCFKPCTVSKKIMNEKGITFAYSEKTKLHAKHNEQIQFVCVLRSMTMTGNARNTCIDGFMPFPSCH